MPGYGHQNGWYQLVENFHVYLYAKNQINLSPAFWNIAFGYFGHAWWHPTKTIVPTCRKCWCLYTYKNQLNHSFLSWDIAKILQSRYFGYIGYGWLWPPKRMVLALKKLWCLSSCKKKSNSPLPSFLNYC